MKLYCLDSYDYCALKIVLVGSAVGADVSLERVSAEKIKDLHSEAKSLLLETPQGMEVTQSGMLDYLTGLTNNKSLKGENDQESTLIKSMIDSCWSDFGEFQLRLEFTL